MVHALGLNNPYQIQHEIHLRQDWKSDCNSEATGSPRSFMIIENLYKISWPKNVIKMSRIQEGQLKRKEVEKRQDSRVRPSTYLGDTGKRAVNSGKGRMFLDIDSDASMWAYLPGSIHCNNGVITISSIYVKMWWISKKARIGRLTIGRVLGEFAKLSCTLLNWKATTECARASWQRADDWIRHPEH